MIRRLLIANRGEIAVRIIRTCRQLGIETVLACSEADRHSLPAELADRAIAIGPAPASRSYLDPALVVHAALSTGCDAIHPGYGFLSERPELATLCAENDLIFIGPDAATIARLGDKLEARRAADAADTPRILGTEALSSAEDAVIAADTLGYPVLLKAAAGGGGRGMAVAYNADDVARAYPRLAKEANDAFGDGTLYAERFIERARHVEIQAVGDGHGHVLALGDRDCSVQRRHQKVIEEAPATAMPDATRSRMSNAAVAMLASLNYRGAGTVEFLYDQDRDEIAFIEVNARIQVEHPVTEEILGTDIVALQLAVAAGERLNERLEEPRGHAVELRINAEDPLNGFTPSPGRITGWQVPSDCRVDTFCREGHVVVPYYDSLLAKLIVGGRDRAEAIQAARRALAAFQIDGIATNLPLLRAICDDPVFIANTHDTKWLERELLPRFGTNPKRSHGPHPAA